MKKKRNIQAVLNMVLVSLYLLSLFSVGMYEAEKITFKECMYDMIVYLGFGVINYIAKKLVRNARVV